MFGRQIFRLIRYLNGFWSRAMISQECHIFYGGKLKVLTTLVETNGNCSRQVYAFFGSFHVSWIWIIPTSWKIITKRKPKSIVVHIYLKRTGLTLTSFGILGCKRSFLKAFFLPNLTWVERSYHACTRLWAWLPLYA